MTVLACTVLLYQPQEVRHQATRITSSARLSEYPYPKKMPLVDLELGERRDTYTYTVSCTVQMSEY